jgi:hypothetical protein
MRTSLSSEDRTKLIRILGMLGSEFDGERAAAGALASRMLKDADLAWADVVSPHIEIYAQDRPRRQQAKPEPDIDPIAGRDWRIVCEICRKHPTRLTAWEDIFLRDTPKRADITIPQRRNLVAIVLRLRAAGCVV